MLIVRLRLLSFGSDESGLACKGRAINLLMIEAVDYVLSVALFIFDFWILIFTSAVFGA